MDAVDAAEAIGARLARQALWHGDACTWNIANVDSVDPWSRRVSIEPAGGSLYNGTAGIAIFLSELYGRSGDRGIRRAADGAFVHALRFGTDLPGASFGFYSGRIGIAWALARHAQITGDARHADHARDILRPVFGNEGNDQARDIVGGAAGAIPPLLLLADILDLPDARTSAIALGLSLVRTACRNPIGWSWRSPDVFCARDLLGFAHGAAGYGYALLELYAATGCEWARYGAERAFEYEDQFYDAAAANWPDFRYANLNGAFRMPARTAALRASLLAGNPIPTYVPRYMWGWCHGAPGIGLTRLRAYELLRDQRYAVQSKAAASSTANYLRRRVTNYSLCHGAFGNAETLLTASRVLKTKIYAEVTEAVAAIGIEHHEKAGKAWPSGATGAHEDPSLMLGEAGIGHFLLRLRFPEIPSVLQVTTLPDGQWLPERDSPTVTIQELDNLSVDQYFAQSIRAFELLQPERPSPREDAAATSGPRAMALRQTLTARVADEIDPELATLLADAMLLDAKRFAMTLDLADFMQPRLRQLARPPISTVDWDTTHVALEVGVAMVETAVDWEHWISSPETPVAASASKIGFLLFSRHGTIHIRRLGTFGTRIFAALAQPRSLDDVVRLLAVEFDADPTSLVAVRHRVMEQVQTAYTAGLVRLIATS